MNLPKPVDSEPVHRVSELLEEEQARRIKITSDKSLLILPNITAEDQGESEEHFADVRLNDAVMCLKTAMACYLRVLKKCRANKFEEEIAPKLREMCKDGKCIADAAAEIKQSL